MIIFSFDGNYLWMLTVKWENNLVILDDTSSRQKILTLYWMENIGNGIKLLMNHEEDWSWFTIFHGHFLYILCAITCLLYIRDALNRYSNNYTKIYIEDGLKLKIESQVFEYVRVSKLAQLFNNNLLTSHVGDQKGILDKRHKYDSRLLILVEQNCSSWNF